MKHSYKFARALQHTAALGALALAACVGNPDDMDSYDDEGVEAELSEQSLTPVWTRCATAGGHCMFTGTRKVRYGQGSTWTIRTFTDGAHCSRSTFAVTTARRSGNVCEYDAAVAPAPTPTATPTPMPMPMPMGNMPYVNKAKIPTGDPGVADVRIRSTLDKPSPSDGTGAFRTVCDFSHMNFDDPIVYPGQPGKAHLHAYFGNTGANAYVHGDVDPNDRELDVSGRHRQPHGVLGPGHGGHRRRTTPVAPDEMVIYYKSGYGGVGPEDVRAMPTGLRMIAGRHGVGRTPVARELGVRGPRLRQPHRPHPGLRRRATGCIMMLDFPQCWDGVNLDSANHKSHLAYPTGGGCPASHPVAIPVITYNVYTEVPPGHDTADWRLSSDTIDDPELPGGYSAHGDWFDGWDAAVAQAFVTNCDNKAVDCKSHLVGDGREIYYK